jgi:hypothetical protein
VIEERGWFSGPLFPAPNHEIDAIKSHQLACGREPEKACSIKAQTGDDGFWQAF